MNISLSICEKDLELGSSCCIKDTQDKVPDILKAEQNDNFDEFNIFGKKFGHCLIDWHIEKLGYDYDEIYKCLKLDATFRSSTQIEEIEGQSNVSFQADCPK
ncbi:hypothetical protein SPONN_430 [uncultured Candidatus Thioglobus sp.]|nr:hypothetical protein SPONN_430 [uncultured Candidatus Thioglobus sp.]